MISRLVRELINTYVSVHAGLVGGRLKDIASKKKGRQIELVAVKSGYQRLALFKMCKSLNFDRHVRSLSKCVEKYKHHEIRDILIYFLISVCSSILQDDKLEHLFLLQFSVLLIGCFVQYLIVKLKKRPAC